MKRCLKQGASAFVVRVQDSGISTTEDTPPHSAPMAAVIEEFNMCSHRYQCSKPFTSGFSFPYLLSLVAQAASAGIGQSALFLFH